MKGFGSLFAAMEHHSRRERVVFAASAAVALLTLLVDQATKLWVVGALHESRTIIPAVLEFTRVRNTGAAFGMLSGQTWLLLLVALAAFLAILFFFYDLCENYPERYFSLLLVLSGILGNSIDRLWRGNVVDFIHVHYKDVWHYAVFNVADIAICVGVGVFVLSSLIRPDRKKAAGNSAGKPKWFGVIKAKKQPDAPEKDEDR